MRQRAGSLSTVALALVIAALGGCQARANPVPNVTNDRLRIVSLAPSITETLFAIGAGPEVVGVSQYCDFPKAALKLPRVGSFLTPNIEEIVALRPTLIIGVSISSDTREFHALRAMGFRTLMLTDSTIGGIERSILQIGDATGRPIEARRLLGRLRRHLSAISERLRNVPTRRVLMVVGHQPMIAVGRGTFLDQLLKLAHADNIADAAGESWPRLSLEYIIASRPEVILDGAMGTVPPVPGDFWSRYRTIPAVRDGRVYGYPSEPTLQPGPRIWQSLEILARLIHPRSFSDAAGNRAGSHRESGAAPGKSATEPHLRGKLSASSGSIDE